LDRALYGPTGGRLLSTGPAFPTLLLTTVGRRSGRPRTTPLFFLRDGERILVASTVRGDWARNLLACPRVEVRIGRRRGRFLAREASEEEFERWWQRFTDFWPPYRDYQERSGRAYVYILEPDATAAVSIAAEPTARIRS
jgi:deazaflavin-dependent oxidoreductase (nitroreductase family)